MNWSKEEVEALADALSERITSRLGHKTVMYVDKGEAARLLGCSISTIERHTRSGKLPSWKLGGIRRYRYDDLNSFGSQT